MRVVFLLPLIVCWLLLVAGTIANNKLLLFGKSAIPLVAGILGLIILSSKQLIAIDRRMLMIISPGLISCGIGDIIWDYYELILKVEVREPFTSTTFYYIFYITSAVALALINSLIYRKLYEEKDKIVLFIAYFVIPVTLIAIILLAFLGIGLTQQQSLISSLIILGYVIFDIVIISLLVYPIYKFAGGEISKFYLLYIIGILFIAIGDLVHWILGNLYQTGSLIDFTWIVGDSIIYIALYQKMT